MPVCIIAVLVERLIAAVLHLNHSVLGVIEEVRCARSRWVICVGRQIARIVISHRAGLP